MVIFHSYDSLPEVPVRENSEVVIIYPDMMMALMVY
jgi:hypothetical protein